MDLLIENPKDGTLLVRYCVRFGLALGLNCPPAMLKGMKLPSRTALLPSEIRNNAAANFAHPAAHKGGR
jgi:hypothetical protein